MIRFSIRWKKTFVVVIKRPLLILRWCRDKHLYSCTWSRLGMTSKKLEDKKLCYYFRMYNNNTTVSNYFKFLSLHSSIEFKAIQVYVQSRPMSFTQLYEMTAKWKSWICHMYKVKLVNSHQKKIQWVWWYDSQLGGRKHL